MGSALTNRFSALPITLLLGCADPGYPHLDARALTEGWAAADTESFNWASLERTGSAARPVQLLQVVEDVSCLRSGRAQVYGSLGDAEVADLYKMSQEIQKTAPVIWIRGTEDLAEIHTGRDCSGPGSGSGYTLQLTKVRGQWVLKRVVPWIG